MQSSSGTYLSTLDHLRAFAAFQVFVWHFVHQSANCPAICFARDYSVGSILEEGHTGVSLFMCISGYVFAKLTVGQRVNVMLFWYNRMVRLLPLLIVWSLITVISGLLLGTLSRYDRIWLMTPVGMIRKILAPGGWSIIVELQFYALFPLLLLFARRFGAVWLLALIPLMLMFRGIYWHLNGSVQYLSYWTLAGRLDQFLVGYCAYSLALGQSRRLMLIWGAVALGCFLAAYDVFNSMGGLNGTSRSAIWIFWPTLEAVCYSTIVSAYVETKLPQRIDNALANVGKWSYSIYLSHFYFVPPLFLLLATVMPESFWGRLALALLVFPIIIATSALTYKGIEEPFLRLRRRYVAPQPSARADLLIVQ